MNFNTIEEVIRNKEVNIYSTRFYEELKTFVWKGNKAQAMKGYNDDLVMSMAIGTWLFDASSDYSKSSKTLNDAMLSAFQKKETLYSDTPDAIFNPIGVYGNSHNRNASKKDQIVNQDVNKTINRSKIPDDMLWLLK